MSPESIALAPYLPLLAVLLLATVPGVVVSFTSALLGPKRPSEIRVDGVRGRERALAGHRAPALRGEVLRGRPAFFIVFDVETVFLYPGR